MRLSRYQFCSNLNGKNPACTLFVTKGKPACNEVLIHAPQLPTGVRIRLANKI